MYSTLQDSLPPPPEVWKNERHYDVTIKYLPPGPPPSLNVTAFQHRFNTETLILLHFSLHIWYSLAFSTVVAS